VTVIGLATPVAITGPGVQLTEYPVIVDPLFAAALNDTVADPSPAIAVTFCGAPGGPAGVTLDALAADPVAAVFVAATLHV
jgi:hypothetical protein